MGKLQSKKCFSILKVNKQRNSSTSFLSRVTQSRQADEKKQTIVEDGRFVDVYICLIRVGSVNK